MFPFSTDLDIKIYCDRETSRKLKFFRFKLKLEKNPTIRNKTMANIHNTQIQAWVTWLRKVKHSKNKYPNKSKGKEIVFKPFFIKSECHPPIFLTLKINKWP